VLPPEIYYYVDEGADDEITVEQNEKAFGRILMMPRVLRKSCGTDLRTELFGRGCSAPLGFAPWAMNMIMNRGVGEIGPAKVAGAHQLPYILSSLTNTHPKDITAVNQTGLKMMQLYIN
jgi:isopentenyl diphosphate isomerase/L-lactate dehydrogenase-like FMN-dependent dehydrogenase